MVIEGARFLSDPRWAKSSGGLSRTAGWQSRDASGNASAPRRRLAKFKIPEKLLVQDGPLTVVPPTKMTAVCDPRCLSGTLSPPIGPEERKDYEPPTDAEIGRLYWLLQAKRPRWRPGPPPNTKQREIKSGSYSSAPAIGCAGIAMNLQPQGIPSHHRRDHTKARSRVEVGARAN